MTADATWLPLVEALRRAREAAERGAADPQLTKGAAFTLTAAAIRLPHGDDLRARLENGSTLLQIAALYHDDRCTSLVRAVEASLYDLMLSGPLREAAD